MRLRLYIDNSSMISNIKDRLPISTRRNPLTKARISRDPGSVTEKLSSLGSILLQGTQGTVAVVESAITSTRDPVNSTETAAVVSQAHHEDKHLKLLLTTCTVILDSVNSSENNSNYIQSIDSSSKNILATTKNTLTRSRNNVTVSEAVILHTEDCRNASERMLQIFQDLSDSVKLDRQIVSAFDFGKLPNLKIKSQIQDLSTLPDIMNKIFINEVKTGGYTCQFTFAKGVTENPMESDLYFRPYTVDPGRNPIFINYHGNGHIRRMSTKEYYLFGGIISRMRSQDLIKIRMGIKTVEKNIPWSKTTNATKHQDHKSSPKKYVVLIKTTKLEYPWFAINAKIRRTSVFQEISKLSVALIVKLSYRIVIRTLFETCGTYPRRSEQKSFLERFKITLVSKHVVWLRGYLKARIL
ncbi:hypothetical protein BDF21DRAFT_399178 [Thamnidium elegans]|nr:hypothetical protein BDF21DRAFT_399178 [Thamnidium elegans]